MSNTGFQFNLFGGVEVVGSIEGKIEMILRKYPGTRNNYKLCCFYYWLHYDGLDEILDTVELQAAFEKWFAGSATSPKTIQNRAMEIQREKPGLDACAEVREWRDKQANAGPIGRD